MSKHLALSPRLLVAAVSTFAGIVDAERWAQPGIWAKMVRRQLGVPLEGRWDAALVQHCGYWSHYDHGEDRSGWPVPKAATAEDFAKWGKRLGLLRTDAAVGDIVLQFSPGQKAFVRASVVVRVLAYGQWTPNRPYVDVESIEGDAGLRGELGGGEVLRVARRLSPRTGDRFLRWSEVGGSEGRDATRAAT